VLVLGNYKPFPAVVKVLFPIVKTPVIALWLILPPVTPALAGMIFPLAIIAAIWVILALSAENCCK